MRLVLDPRARRLIARLPRTNWYAASELLLLGLLAVQAARLIWTVATPVEPFGRWRADPAAPTASLDVLGSFDPFFRLAPDAGAAVVTSLQLKLFGVRADQATGRGSAIIGLPDGTQASYAVGDEVMPGVRLDAVRFDGITVLRGGAREQLFLDQSTPAVTVSPLAVPTPVTISPPAAAAPARLQDDVAASPRIIDGRVAGFTLQPRASGEAFRGAGLQPGDVLVAVNGARITDAGSVPNLSNLLAQGNSVTVEIERSGNPVTLTLSASR